MIEIKTPQSNVNDTEAKVVEWLIGDGDAVKAGDAVVTVETSKAAEEVEASADGFLRHKAALGDVVAVGKALGWIVDDANASIDVGGGDNANVKATAKARSLAAEHGIDLADIQSRGVITEKKVRAHIGSSVKPQNQSNLLPATRRVVLSPVQKGVRAAVERSRSQTVEAYMTAEVDVSAILKALDQVAERGGGLVTLTDVLMYRTSRLLRDFPRLNAALDGDQVHEYAEVNVGATVDVDGDLYVVNVHSADELSLSEVAGTRQDQVLKLFKGEKDPKALQGGTFSVTVLDQPNLVHQFPVIFPDQAAILGLGAVQKRLSLNEAGDVVGTETVGVSLTYDHRFINGKMASDFLQAVCNALQNGDDLLEGLDASAKDGAAEFDRADELKAVMAEILECGPEDISETARINKFPNWDSLAQMKMVLAVEEAFDCAISSEQSMKLLSYPDWSHFLAQGPVHGAVASRWQGTPETLRNQVKTALSSIGVEAGATLMVHSFIAEVLHVEGSEQAVIDGMTDAVGNEGTVVMPAFTTAFTDGGRLDRDQDPSEMGTLTEYFRKLDGVEVSPHPYHRFAALGGKAAEICAPHSDTSFGTDSPMAKMHDQDAWIVMVSTDWFPVTFFHYVEEQFGVPYREFKTFTGPIVTGGQEQDESWKMLVRPKGSTAQLAFAEFGERINQAQLSKAAEAGPLHIVAANMKNVYAFTLEALKDDINCLVTT